MKKVTPDTVAQRLADFANEIRSDRPIEEVLLDLEDALESWRSIWPDDTKDDDYDDNDEDNDEDEIQ